MFGVVILGLFWPNLSIILVSPENIIRLQTGFLWFIIRNLWCCHKNAHEKKKKKEVSILTGLEWAIILFDSLSIGRHILNNFYVNL